MVNFPFHLRRQSVALSDSLIKSTLSFFFIFHTQEALLPSLQSLWLPTLNCMSFKSSPTVFFCWFLFVALHFHLCVGIADLKLAEGLERAFISWAAVTNDHKLGWLKAINIFLSPVLEPRSPKSRVSPEFLRDNPSHLYLASGGCNPQLRDASHQSLPPQSHDILLCVQIPSSYKDTVIGFGPWSHKESDTSEQQHHHHQWVWILSSPDYICKDPVSK